MIGLLNKTNISTEHILMWLSVPVVICNICLIEISRNSVRLNMCFSPILLLRILFRSEQNSEELVYKDTEKNSCNRGQYREDLHSHHDLTFGALVDRKEDDPDSAEHQHPECQKLGFIEGVRQIPGLESNREAPQGKHTENPRLRYWLIDWLIVPLLQTKRLCPGSERISISIKGGEDLSQISQIISWIRVQKGMMKFGAPVTINHLILLPGAVNARSIVRVLSKTVETATVETAPNGSAARCMWLGWGSQWKARKRGNKNWEK